MLRVENPLSFARTFETSVKIIPESAVNVGTEALIWGFRKTFPDLDVSFSPVMIAGVILGKDMSKAIGLNMNPLRMSYYRSDGVRLEKPICIAPLNIERVIDRRTGVTKPVAFVEAVVDSQETLLEAMNVVRGQVDEVNRKERTNFSYPEFHIYTQVSKVNGELKLKNFNFAYRTYSDVWVWGDGADSDKKGRLVRPIYGYLAPTAVDAPMPPYYFPSGLVMNYLKQKSS